MVRIPSKGVMTMACTGSLTPDGSHVAMSYLLSEHKSQETDNCLRVSRLCLPEGRRPSTRVD